jgi:hypothetical protein
MKKSVTTEFIEPMMARLVERLPTGKWLYELKFDGYRALAFKAGKEVRLISRNRTSFNADYPKLVEALKLLSAKTWLSTARSPRLIRTGGLLSSFFNRIRKLSNLRSSITPSICSF